MKFHLRSFISFTLFLTLFVMILSGIMLFIKPEGDLAKKISWTIFSLDKKQWENIHIFVTFFFMIAAGFHLYYNWKALKGYLYNKVEKIYRRQLELSLALVFIICIVVLSVGNLDPADWLFDLRKYFKKVFWK